LTCDASSDPFKDADLKCLPGLKRLTSLQLNPRDCSDAGLAHLGGLTDIESLSIGGSRLTDEGLKHLANMKKLKSLTIARGYDRNKSVPSGGDNLTDKSLRYLEGYKDLNVLEIYSDGDFSDAALRRLHQSHPDLTIRLNGGALALDAAPTPRRTPQTPPRPARSSSR
jgi:hypothetical protein